MDGAAVVRRARPFASIWTAHIAAGAGSSRHGSTRIRTSNASRPCPFSVVCFRWSPAGRSLPDQELDAANERLLDAVNGRGEVFLSHTRLRGRVAIRMAIGHQRTQEADVRRAWELLTDHASNGANS